MTTITEKTVFEVDNRAFNSRGEANAYIKEKRVIDALFHGYSTGQTYREEDCARFVISNWERLVEAMKA